MTPEGQLRYISVQEFSETTGVSVSEVKALYAVKVDGFLQVPRFMLDAMQDSVGSSDRGSQEDLRPATSMPVDGATPNGSAFDSGNNSSGAVDYQDSESIHTADQSTSLQDEDDSDRLEPDRNDQTPALIEDCDESERVEGLEGTEDFDSYKTLYSSETSVSSEPFDDSETLDSSDAALTADAFDDYEGRDTVGGSETLDNPQSPYYSETSVSTESLDEPVTLEERESLDKPESHEDTESHENTESHEDSESHYETETLDEPESLYEPESYEDLESLDESESLYKPESLDSPETLYSPENFVSAETLDNSEILVNAETFRGSDAVKDSEYPENFDSTKNSDSFKIHADSESLRSAVVSDDIHSSDSFEHSDIADSSVIIDPELDPFERLKNRIRLSHSQMQAGAFARFFARTFDLALFVSAPAYAYLLFGNSLIDTSTLQQQLIAAIAIVSICIVIALFLDAVCYVLAGNTPGKALLKIRVGDSSGNPLTFKDYLLRNFSVLARGLAFLIFPVTLLTLFKQFRRVNHGQPTSYDLKSGTIVEDDSSGVTNKLLFTIVFLLTLLVAIVGASDLIGLNF